jgi:hypothetical protein
VKKTARKPKPAPDTVHVAMAPSETQPIITAETPVKENIQNVSPDTTTSEPEVTTEPAEKKKGFLKGIFRKKKKDTEITGS